MTSDRSGMHHVKLVGLVLGAVLVLSASVTAADDTKDDGKEARQAAQVNPITEIESRFSPAQRKYMEMLRYLVGLGRTPNILVQACDERFPSNRDQHHQALAKWDANNQAVVEELEKRRAIVVGVRERGNLVQIAETERAFNANVARTTMNMFSATDNDENRTLCANLTSVLASAHYDLEPGSDDSMNAGMIKVMSAVSPSQIEAWYMQ